jgi:hypothetical protein
MSVAENAVLRGFGLSLSLDGARPPGAWRPSPSPVREPALALRVTSAQAVERSWSGRAALGWQATIEGARFLVEVGVAGDHRFLHEGRSVHHLSADRRLLRCAPLADEDPLWWRVVLDSVLFSVALLHGYEALHAAAVAGGDGAIAITAASGGGKSTLVSALLARGLELLADDVLVLETRGSGRRPLAHPAPPLMTVPTSGLPLLAAIEPPPVAISSLADERWMAVPVHPEPLPLASLVVLDRRPGLPTELRAIESPLAPLMGSLMVFPGGEERRRARFELASVLACEVPLWRLTADLRTQPEELADALLAGSLSGTPRASTKPGRPNGCAER